LVSASSASSLHSHIAFEQLKAPHQAAMAAILDFFNSKVDEIEKALNENRDDVFRLIKPWVDQLELLRGIPEIETATANNYHKTVSHLSESVGKLKTDIEQVLAALAEEQGVDYKKLLRCLTIMKSTAWIREKISLYSDLMQDLGESITQYFSHLEHRFQEAQQIQAEAERMQKIANILLQMPEIEGIQELIPSYREKREQIVKQAEGDIEAKLIEIATTFQLSEGERSQDTKAQAKLDFPKAEQSLVYLSVCSDKILSLLSMKLRTDLTRLHSALKKHIAESVEAVCNEMDERFNCITSYANTDSTVLSQNLRQHALFLTYWLKELTRHQQKYTQLFKHLNKQELDKIANWPERLTQYLYELGDDMQSLRAKNDISLKRKIVVAKVLVELDSFLEGGKYKDLYVEYQSHFIAETRDGTVRSLKAIQDHDYATVAGELGRLQALKDNDPVSDHVYKQIVTMAEKHVDESIQDMQYRVILLGNTLERNDVQLIVATLNIIKSSTFYLSDYFNEAHNENLKKVTEDLKSKVSGKIVAYSEKIKGLISVYNFAEAEIRIEHINQVRALLDTYCSEEAATKLDKLQDKLSEELEAQLEKYKGMPITEYVNHQPREMIDRVKQVQHTNIVYSSFLQNIRTLISKNISIALQNSDGMSMLQNKDIRAIELAIKTLPQEMQDALSVELEDRKEHIKSAEGISKEALMLAIEASDSKKIIEFIELYGSVPYRKNEIQREVMTSIRKYTGDIAQSMKDGQVESALKDISSLIQYIVPLLEYVPQLRQSCVPTIRQVLTDEFEATHQVLINIGGGEESSLAEKDYDKRFMRLKIFVEFKNKFEPNSAHLNLLLDILPDFDTKLIAIHESIKNYCIQLQRSYHQNLAAGEVSKLLKDLDTAKRMDVVIRKIKAYSEAPTSKDEQLSIRFLKPILLYNDMRAAVSKYVDNLKSKFLALKLINENTRHFEASKIKSFYETLNQDYGVLKGLVDLRGHVSIEIVDVNRLHIDCMNALKAEVNGLKVNVDTIIKKVDLKKEDYDLFNVSYANLLALKEYMPMDGLDEVINAVQDGLVKQIAILSKQAELAGSAEVFATILINIKKMANNLVQFQDRINQKIDELLKSQKVKQGSLFLNKVCIQLEKDITGVGPSIISEHAVFKGYYISLFNTKTQRHDIEYVLKEIADDTQGSTLDINRLRSCYEEFKEKYERLTKEHLSKTNLDLNQVVSQIKMIVRQQHQSSTEIIWDAALRNKIPNLMAHIFALWTLKNATYYFESGAVENRESYLLQAHPAQVISIFRILGLGYPKQMEKETYFEPNPFPVIGSLLAGTYLQRDVVVDPRHLFNHLVQIGTGEGKSVTLAVTASVLALLGFDVSCACYSEYLSRRDYEEFTSIFTELGVVEHVHYGTFNEVCEGLINQNGDIRQRVLKLVNPKDATTATVLPNRKEPRAKILLIDEVDVFFNKDFYGNLYTPTASLVSPVIGQLTDAIWKRRNEGLNLRIVKEMPAYKQCVAEFPKWDFLIEEAVKDMVADVKNFHHDYLVHNDKIAYKEQDGISYKIAYGYKTLFAYYHEYQEGTISEKSLRDYISIGINCGSFSYADIPKKFQYIMGVTGTLKTLSMPQRRVVHDLYQVRKVTYSPSVFGANNLEFREEADVRIENSSDYLNVIAREIQDKMVGAGGNKRAVIVFFKTRDKLMEFYRSPALAAHKDAVQILTEEVALKEKEMLIKRATASGQITLLTRSFGRGTNFVCRDQMVATNGGVHVLQTFLSEELSEETQIKGRTARQSDRGSYSMILLDESLEEFFISKQELEQAKKERRVYALLNDKRNAFFEVQYADNEQYVQAAQVEHQKAEHFVQSINNGDFRAIQAFLTERNKGTVQARSRTICLMDATGSMSHLLQKTKNTVGTMFERAAEVLKENGIAVNSFEMQFAVYRNYNSYADKLLQFSTWESKPENLRAFMNGIGAEGGWGNEAIEIGLWHANQESGNGDVSQVILIGDAPPNTDEDVKMKRSDFKDSQGESYWAKTQFPSLFSYRSQLQELKRKKIVVHAFYVDRKAKASFDEIARETGGRSAALEINSSAGAELLTSLVTEEVLRNVGGSDKGDTLVQSYRKKFQQKSYK